MIIHSTSEITRYKMSRIYGKEQINQNVHLAWNRQAQIDIAQAIAQLSGLHIIVKAIFSQPNHLLWTHNRTALLRETIDSFSWSVSRTEGRVVVTKTM